MAPALLCLVAGTLMVLLRRPWAREIKRSQERWFDRTYDEDGLAWWISAMGCLAVVGGIVFLGIWVFG